MYFGSGWTADRAQKNLLSRGCDNKISGPSAATAAAIVDGSFKKFSAVRGMCTRKVCGNLQRLLLAPTGTDFPDGSRPRIFGEFPLCFPAALIRRDAPFAFVSFEMSELRDFNYYVADVTH